MESSDLLISGGAEGADTLWAQCAIEKGHHVKIMSFDKHKFTTPRKADEKNFERVVLSKEELKEGKAALEVARVKLGRSKPSNPWKANFLLRDYYQVKDATIVYAVGFFEKGPAQSVGIDGGTGFTCQMFSDMELARLKKEGEAEERNPFSLFFFDQRECKWFQAVHLKDDSVAWDSIDSPPKPSGTYTGIGTREIQASGIGAVEKLFGSME